MTTTDERSAIDRFLTEPPRLTLQAPRLYDIRQEFFALNYWINSRPPSPLCRVDTGEVFLGLVPVKNGFVVVIAKPSDAELVP